LMVFSPHWFL